MSSTCLTIAQNPEPIPSHVLRREIEIDRELALHRRLGAFEGFGLTFDEYIAELGLPREAFRH